MDTRRVWIQKFFLIAIGIVSVYVLVYIDLTLRARHAYMEGEKYLAWNSNPTLKQQFLQNEFDQKKTDLDKKYDQKKIADGEYRNELQALEFDRQFQMNESSLKYAYVWYKDAYELFSPPESKWARMAREKAPQALELWKQELREKKIPFEETMVQ